MGGGGGGRGRCKSHSRYANCICLGEMEVYATCSSLGSFHKTTSWWLLQAHTVTMTVLKLLKHINFPLPLSN